MSGGNPFDFGRPREPDNEPEPEPEREDRPRPAKRRREKTRFRCPYCGSSQPPEVISKVSVGGWITFWVLFLLMCWPFFLFALMMTENVAYCGDCGMKLADYIGPGD